MANGAAEHTAFPAYADEMRFRVLGAVSFSHFLNDLMQSLIVSIYPLLKAGFNLSFAQVGLITLTYQVCASILQPLVGMYTDRHPQSHSLAIGMGFTLCGILTLAFSTTYAVVLFAAALIGAGSSIFHPESARITRLASGGRLGLAQSIFQVGGNAGSAAGPLLAAWIVIPHGQSSLAWFALLAVLAIAVLWNVGNWYKRRHLTVGTQRARKAPLNLPVSQRTVRRSLVILLVLIFSKYFYLASISSYYTFYLIEKFHVPVRSAQLFLFVFMFAVALGAILGGWLGDRVGRKIVIWVSILGVAPFALALPYVGLIWTGVLSFIIGLILASAFSAIVVFAQELVPGKVGTVSGLFFGFAFGIGGIGAAVLGAVADRHGVEFVYRVCAFLPLLGVVTAFLPDIERRSRSHRQNVRGP
jgi:FSR family fosmidomycin resistance protein-like MFS transporter